MSQQLPNSINIDWTNSHGDRVPGIGDNVRNRTALFLTPRDGGPQVEIEPATLGVVVGYKGYLYSNHPKEPGNRYFLCPVVLFPKGQDHGCDAVGLVPNEVETMEESQ